MKKILVTTMLILSFFGCNHEKDKKKNLHKVKQKNDSTLKNPLTKEKLDTVVVYWQTKYDTVFKNEKLNIENNNYELELKSYSLNDSSRVRWNSLNKPTIYKDIYHDYVTDVVLKKDIVYFFRKE